MKVKPDESCGNSGSAIKFLLPRSPHAVWPFSRTSRVRPWCSNPVRSPTSWLETLWETPGTKSFGPRWPRSAGNSSPVRTRPFTASLPRRLPGDEGISHSLGLPFLLLFGPHFAVCGRRPKMSNSRRTAGTPWAYGALLAAMAGGAVLIARERGWLDSLPQLKRTSPAKIELAANAVADTVPSPFDPVEFDGDSGPRMSPSESDDPAPEPVRQNDASVPRPGIPRRQDSGGVQISLSLDDGIEDDSSDSSRSKIATAGFEENAPPAPSSSQDEPARERNSSGPNKPAVAARPTDATKAAGSAGNGAATLTRGAPLMDRDRIEQLIEEGEFVEAQKELSRWYWQNPDGQEELLPQLNKMAQALYFSPQPLYYEPYVVKPGDQLRVVGQRYKISWEYIARLNQVDARKIRMGQKLKVVPGPFAATVFLDRYELVVHQNGSFVKNYRVGVGKDGTTPIGTFTVKNKMVDPTYYGPEGVIAHDDPNNPLGERWIDIGDSYGIHGTIDPDSIGKNESRGCIRMLNSDVEEVYDFLVIGSEVKIQK